MSRLSKPRPRNASISTPNGSSSIQTRSDARSIPEILLPDGSSSHHVILMCGRIIQSSAPIPYGIVEDGMNVRDSRVHNYPPRWKGAPIRQK